MLESLRNSETMSHYKTASALGLECTSLDLSQGWPLGRGEQCELPARVKLLDFFPCWGAPQGHAPSGPVCSD